MLFASLTALGAELPAGLRQGAWEILDRSLHDGNTEHRQQAITALSTMGEVEEAVKRVESALDDKDPQVRQSAALALGAMKAHSAAHRLEQALDDTPEVAFAAAKALTEIGDDSGQALLVAVLSGERKGGPGMMTNVMRKAKSNLHHPEGLVLKGAQDATGAMFGPVSLAIPAAKDLIDLKDKGAPGRAAAAAYLSKDPDPYAVALLEWALNDDQALVRLEGAKGLGQRGNLQSAAKLEPLLKDGNELVRDMAAASIIRIDERNGADGSVSTAPVTPATPAKNK
jgi:HEAT repeat protein